MTYLILLLYVIAASEAQHDREYYQQQNQPLNQKSEEDLQPQPPPTPPPQRKQNETKAEVKTALCAIKGILQPTPMAIDAKRFVDLVIRGNMFIDKTMMIKDLFDYGPPIRVIAKPKGWGKTMNLDMVKTFFEIEVDEETGNAVGYRELTPNYDLFYHGQVQMEDGNVKKIKTPLLIAKHHDFMEEHQGQHAVIYMNFDDFQPETYKDLKDGLTSRFRDVFLAHKYMQKVLEGVISDPDVSDQEKTFARRHLTSFNNVLDANIDEDCIKGCIKSLCELLTWHFGRKPIILIEEYDAPILKVLLATTRINKDRVVNFYKSFINQTFDENVNLEKALFTGTMRLLDEDTPSLMYDANEDIFFSEYQGFNAKEVEWIFDHLQIPEKLRVQAIAHYGGYNIDLNEKVNISRCSSIAKFVACERIEEHFEANPRLDTLISSFYNNMEFTQTLHGFVCGWSTVIRLNWDVIYFNFNDIKHTLLLSNYDKISYKSFSKEYHVINSIIYIVIKLLCATGYLTLNTRERDEVTTKIPNQNVRIFFKTQLLSHYASRIHLKYNPKSEIKSLSILSEAFEHFLRTDDNDTQHMTSVFDTFLCENLLAFQQNRYIPKMPSTRAAFIHSLLNFITLYIDRFRLIHTETYLIDNDTQAITDIVLIHNNGVHGIVVAFGMGNRPLKYLELLTAPRMDLFYTDNKPIIKTVRRVVAQITPKACFQISAKWSIYENVRIGGNRPDAKRD